MRKIEKKYFIELIADENKIIVSKSKHYDEYLEKEVFDVEGETIYLPLNSNIEDYEEIDREVTLDGTSEDN